MSNDAAAKPQTPDKLWLALVGLALMPLSPVFWAFTLDNSFLRWTGLVMWIAMALALVCAALAAWWDTRKRTRMVAAATALWVLFSIPAFFIFTRLPDPTGIGSVTRSAEVVLSDHRGQQTSLTELLREQAVLIAFYRGHW